MLWKENHQCLILEETFKLLLSLELLGGVEFRECLVSL